MTWNSQTGTWIMILQCEIVQYFTNQMKQGLATSDVIL